MGRWFKLYHLPTDILCSGSAIPQPGEKKYDKEMWGPVVFRCGLEIGRSGLTLTARPCQSGALELPCLDWDNAKH